MNRLHFGTDQQQSDQVLRMVFENVAGAARWMDLGGQVYM